MKPIVDKADLVSAKHSMIVIVAGHKATPIDTATNQVNVACPPACLLRRFQVAWINGRGQDQSQCRNGHGQVKKIAAPQL